MKPSPSLSRVQKGELCSGCGLCAGVSGGAISLHTQAPGYARPLQNRALTPQQEELIAKACPGLSVYPWQQDQSPAPTNSSVYWGPWERCLTGFATDARFRHQGASGGVLSALAAHALASGLAEQVVHIGADPARPTRNITLLSTTPEQVLSGAGSRYAASSPLEDISALLDAGRRSVFIGKPCDVSALRQLALLDSRVDKVFPYKLSFFCGGLPSHAGADRIVTEMGLDPAAITQFRYRGEGWPGLTRAVDAEGRTGEMRYEDSWGGHLSKEVQFRCKICPDAVGGAADIACADAWYGGETGYPQFEEQDGRSLVLTRTKDGNALLESAQNAGMIAVTPLPVDDISLMQPSQARRKRRVGARVLASRMMLQPTPNMRGLMVGAAARLEGTAGLLRDFIGTARRIVLKRR